jgi:PIN domain nuclease of toxin-antitoxin system
MRALLDTHAFLWFSQGSENLSQEARAIIEDRAAEVYLSDAGVWEMVIKAQLGKLTLDLPVGELVDAQATASGLLSLPITRGHIEGVAALPLHHRDPFDRLLASQCLAEDLVLISADRAFDAYAVKRVW